MKVKDLERTANIAWSPANVNPIYLAAGTAAQQLDASFETNASLEIFHLNLADPGSEMELKTSTPTESRFNKIVWGPYGSDFGTIAAGCEKGSLQIFNASKLLNKESALVSKQDKHTGPIHSVDFNPFQPNLLASGAASSEIFIWDMNNSSAPMTPGPKLQPLEDVLSVQWNRQVQHILATTFATKCVVWDLRKNETIIKLSDTVSRIRWKVVAWHPEVATQLCLASEEDQAPIIQLWDLRFATSPLKTLENHQRGLLSMAWCSQDPDLLISTAKDNRIVCWNPNSNQAGGEVLSEVARTNQWNFDVCWCPKNPALVATPGFDGHVSVYSLMGGKAQQIQTTNKIADSFPGMDGYVQAPVQQAAAPVSVDLSKAPKWLKKPVGASFGFGGKLITFENNCKSSVQQNGESYVSRVVTVCQIVTEEELIQKSSELEQALELGNFTEYCRAKADSSTDQHTKYIWHFLKANFENNPRAELLNLLGYKIEDVNAKLSEHVDLTQSNLNDVASLTQDFSNNRIDSVDPFGDIQQQQQQQEKAQQPYKIKTGDDADGLIAQALLLNNVEAAVELCLKHKRFADAIIIAMSGGPEIFARTQTKYLAQCEGYVSSLISALVSEDWGSVVSNCDIQSWREALAAAITHSSDEDLPILCEMMGNRLEQESRSTNNPKLLHEAQLCYICAGSFDDLVASWTTSKTLSSSEELQHLVELVTFLQKSVERQGRNVSITGRLADLLSKYAGILASQGHLNTALAYLGSSRDERVTLLRDRLYVALGHKPAYEQQVQRSRHNTARTSITGYPPIVNQNVVNQKPYQPTAIAAPTWKTNATGEFQQQQPASIWDSQAAQPPPPPQNTFQPWQPSAVVQQTPSLPPPTASSQQQQQQPSRPASNGPAGLLPRNKYIVDPSVQSTAYGRPSSNYGATPYVPPTSFGGGPLLQNSAPSMVGNQYNTAPLIPQTPIQTQPEFSAPPPTTGAMMNKPMSHVPPPLAAPGWNDPPVLSKSTKTNLPKPQEPIQSPITHPIYGTALQQQHQPPMGNANGYLDNQQQQQQPFYPNLNNNPLQSPPPMQKPPPMGVGAANTAMFTPQQQPPLPSGGHHHQNFNAFNTHAVPPANNQGGAAVEAAERASPAVELQQQQQQQPAPKLPIPEEHIHMQTVLDALRMQCSRAANNPQTKRKIDDVGKKLETLYDLLREHKLSPNTLSTLHQLIQAIQHGDYNGGLSLHTQLVCGPDFSQIASFMPGIKVLLQCAIQLQVYLR